MTDSDLRDARRAALQAISRQDSPLFEKADQDSITQLCDTLANLSLLLSRTWQQLYEIFLCRLPSAKDSKWFDRTPRTKTETIRRLIDSNEFQEVSALFIAEAMPEKSLIVFIHIDKAAGTSVKNGIRYSAKAIPWDRQWRFMPDFKPTPSRNQLFSFLRSQWEYPNEPCWILDGHAKLQSFFSRNLIRPTTKIFTSFRNPRDRFISSLNYRFARAKNYPEIPLYRRWAEEFCNADPRFSFQSPEPPADFVSRLIRNSDFSERFRSAMCSYFGDECQAADIAIDVIEKHHIQTSDDTNIREFMQENFAVSLPVERSNQSDKVFFASDIGESDLDYLDNDLLFEDWKLYRWHSKRIAKEILTE